MNPQVPQNQRLLDLFGTFYWLALKKHPQRHLHYNHFQQTFLSSITSSFRVSQPTVTQPPVSDCLSKSQSSHSNISETIKTQNPALLKQAHQVWAFQTESSLSMGVYLLLFILLESDRKVMLDNLLRDVQNKLNKTDMLQKRELPVWTAFIKASMSKQLANKQILRTLFSQFTHQLLKITAASYQEDKQLSFIDFLELIALKNSRRVVYFSTIGSKNMILGCFGKGSDIFVGHIEESNRFVLTKSASKSLQDELHAFKSLQVLNHACQSVMAELASAQASFYTAVKEESNRGETNLEVLMDVLFE